MSSQTRNRLLWATTVSLLVSMAYPAIGQSQASKTLKAKFGGGSRTALVDGTSTHALGTLPTARGLALPGLDDIVLLRPTLNPLAHDSESAATPTVSSTPARDPSSLPEPGFLARSRLADGWQQLGVPAPKRHAKISQSARGIFDFAPYGLNNGVDWGLSKAAGFQGMNLVARLGPQYFGSGLRSPYSQSLANAMAEVDRKFSNIGLYNTTLLQNGYQNPFAGQIPYPGTWNTSFQGSDPFYSGGGFSSGSDQTILSVLGYSNSSNLNFGAQFLNQVNSFYQPWNAFSSFGFAGSQTASKQAGVASALELVRSQYQEIADAQLGVYFLDNTLYGLREESSRVLLALIYTDPLYLFWSYQLNALYNAFFVQAPSYQTLVALANEVASWTVAATDIPTLKQRYEIRTRLLQTYASVAYETNVNLILNGWGPWIRDVQTFLALRLQANAQTPEVQAWDTDWTNRWVDGFAGAPGFTQLSNKMNDLFAQFPLFQEYLDLRNEMVGSVIPSFEQDPVLDNLINQTAALQQNQSAIQPVTQLYNGFTQDVRSLVDASNVNAEIERYYEQLNGLIINTPEFIELVNRANSVLVQLQNYQKTVHDLVLPYVQNGRPEQVYSDPNIVNFILSSQTTLLIRATGDLYVLYNLFWYAFFNGSSYAGLERDTESRVAGAAASIEGSILARKQRFNSDIMGITPIRQFFDLRENAVATLRSQSSRLNNGLNRMSEIVAELFNVTSVDPGRPESVPESFSLEQNYPNPFNPRTSITYSMPRASRVKMVVYNMLGQEVRTLVDDYQAAGSYSVTWDGLTNRGEAAASGVYMYTLRAEGVSLSRKLVLLK